MPPAWCEPYRRFRPEQLSYLLLHGGGPSPTSNPSAIRHCDPERGAGGDTYPVNPGSEMGPSPWPCSDQPALRPWALPLRLCVGLIGVHWLGVN